MAFDRDKWLLETDTDYTTHPLNSKPSIKWFGVGRDRTRYPREKSMEAKDWGWDATCSCGWDSKSGGAIMASIKRDVQEHKEQHEIHQEWAARQKELKSNTNLGRQFD